MLQASKHVSRDLYQFRKIKFSLKAQNDRTTCLAIEGFVWTILNFDRKLSVDRPLFQALHIVSHNQTVDHIQTLSKWSVTTHNKYYTVAINNFCSCKV